MTRFPCAAARTAHMSGINFFQPSKNIQQASCLCEPLTLIQKFLQKYIIYTSQFKVAAPCLNCVVQSLGTSFFGLHIVLEVTPTLVKPVCKYIYIVLSHSVYVDCKDVVKYIFGKYCPRIRNDENVVIPYQRFHIK